MWLSRLPPNSSAGGMGTVVQSTWSDIVAAITSPCWDLVLPWLSLCLPQNSPEGHPGPLCQRAVVPSFSSNLPAPGVMSQALENQRSMQQTLRFRIGGGRWRQVKTVQGEQV